MRGLKERERVERRDQEGEKGGREGEGGEEEEEEGRRERKIVYMMCSCLLTLSMMNVPVS